MANETTAILKTDITADAGKFVAAINKATETTKTATAAMSKSIQSVDESIKSTGSLIDTLTNNWGKLASLVGAGLLIKGFIDTTRAIDDLADKAQSLGLSVDQIQRFTYATKTLGGSDEISLSILDQATHRLGEFEAGIGKARKVFDGFNIDIKQFKGLNAFEAIEKLSDVTQGLDRTARVKVFDTFAEGLSKFLPLLDQGKKGVETLNDEFDKLGLGLSANQLAGASKFADGLDKLTAIWDGFRNQLASNLAEPLGKLLNQIIESIKSAGGIEGATRAISAALLNAAATFFDAIQWLVHAVVSFGQYIEQVFSRFRHPFGANSIDNVAAESITHPQFTQGSSSNLLGNIADSLRQFSAQVAQKESPEIKLFTEATFAAKSALDKFSTTVDKSTEQLGRDLEKFGADLGTKVFDEILKRQKDIKEALHPGSTGGSLGEFANKDAGLTQINTDAFRREVQSLLEDAQKGLAQDVIKSRISGLQSQASLDLSRQTILDLQDSKSFNKDGFFTPSHTNSKELGAIEDLKKLLLNEEQPKIKVDVEVKASREFEAQYKVTAQNAAIELAAIEARKVAH